MNNLPLYDKKGYFIKNDISRTINVSSFDLENEITKTFRSNEDSLSLGTDKDGRVIAYWTRHELASDEGPLTRMHWRSTPLEPMYQRLDEPETWTAHLKYSAYVLYEGQHVYKYSDGSYSLTRDPNLPRYRRPAYNAGEMLKRSFELSEEEEAEIFKDEPPFPSIAWFKWLFSSN